MKIHSLLYEELWNDYPNYKIRHNNDLFPLFIDKPMMYPKGERFQYNNSGYVLLASIIEKVSGVPFDEYLQINVLDVCDMKSTGYYELDKLPAKCANHYIYCSDTKSYRTNIFSVDVKGTGAGGAYITAYFQGCDPGVSFISEYNPNNGMISVLVSNYGDNVWKEMRNIRENFYK